MCNYNALVYSFKKVSVRVYLRAIARSRVMEGEEGCPLFPDMGSEHSGNTVMLWRKSKTQRGLVWLL